MAGSEVGFTATVTNNASQSVQISLNTGSSFDPGIVSQPPVFWAPVTRVPF